MPCMKFFGLLFQRHNTTSRLSLAVGLWQRSEPHVDAAERQPRFLMLLGPFGPYDSVG